MTSPAQTIAAKINALSVKDAVAVYSGLRIAHADATRAKADHAAGLMQVMVMAGDALEARIGEAEFYALLDRLDAQIYA